MRFAPIAAGVGMLAAVVVLTATMDAVTAYGQTPTTTVIHWGSFFGDSPGHNPRLLSPTTITLPGPVVQVATSNSTQYALLANGTVYAWGLGDDGQLGDGGRSNSLTTAVEVRFPPRVTIASLPTDAMPYNTGLAIDTKGHAWGWGFNSAGQLCMGNADEYLTPVELPFTDVTTMAGAGDHALYDSDGTVYACGGNENGDLGDGSTTPSKTPVTVHALDHDGDVTELVASFNDSGALLSDGTYLDWGYNELGQVGNGPIISSSLQPVAVSLPLPVIEVAQGGSSPNNGQTLVVLSDGSLRSWGADHNGQLGNGQTINEPLPVAFSALPGVKFTSVASGGNTSYAVSTTGDLYSWGGGGDGQIGDGETTWSTLAPVKVESGVSFVSATAQNVAVVQGSVGQSARRRSTGSSMQRSTSSTRLTASHHAPNMAETICRYASLADQPPSTGTTAPLMNDARSETRNAPTSATSWGCPAR